MLCCDWKEHRQKARKENAYKESLEGGSKSAKGVQIRGGFASLKRRLVKRRFEFLWALAWEKTQIRHDLPPLLTQFFFSSLLFVDDLFSVCFLEYLCIFFSRSFSLDIPLYTYAFSYSLSRSSRRILPISASFLASLRVFLVSLYAVYLLLSLINLSLSIQPIFTRNPLSTNLNDNIFLQLTKL